MISSDILRGDSSGLHDGLVMGDHVQGGAGWGLQSAGSPVCRECRIHDNRGVGNTI